MIGWHAGLFAALFFGQIGVNGRKQQVSRPLWSLVAGQLLLCTRELTDSMLQYW